MSEQEMQLLSYKGQLVSLSQASKFCPYTQEYLSLLARKRRIPAIKIARNWLTTREAILSYVEEQKNIHTEYIDKVGEIENEVTEK